MRRLSNQGHVRSRWTWIARVSVANLIGIRVGRGVDPRGGVFGSDGYDHRWRLHSVCRRRHQGDWLGPGRRKEKKIKKKENQKSAVNQKITNKFKNRELMQVV